MSLPEVKPKIKENHRLFLGPSPTFLPSFRECKPPLIVNIPNKSLNQKEFLVHDGTLPQNQNSQFTPEKMVAKEDGTLVSEVVGPSRDSYRLLRL